MRPIRVPEDIVLVSDFKAKAAFLAAVDEGLADSEAGRVHSHASVVAEIKRRRQARSSR